MTKALRYINVFIFSVLLIGKIYAQDTTTNDFFDEIKAYDLSAILISDSILTEDRDDGNDKFKRAEILGFIGDNYQRFFIHFVSVIKNPTNPYQYMVFGKTKVEENIRSFQGTITIAQSRIYKSGDIPTYKQGFAMCDVCLYEDKKLSSAGCIRGSLKSDFLIDNNGQFRYDAISFNADGFSNNQFIGSWSSYKTNTTKKCNWGDYRVPECNWENSCDIGAGEFSISDKYLKNGWENYRLASTSDPNTTESKRAKQKENEQWWK